jgi:hypothetical protein
MAEKRSSSARLSGPTNIAVTRIATAVARPSRKRRSPPNADDSRTPKSTSAIPKRSRCFNSLVIQLSVDPLVRSIKYVDSLSALRRRVKVEMLVAERADGRFAYDLIDERSPRDLDEEGLVLIALQENGIGLIEVDRTQVNKEPQASNCLLIWKHRSHPVEGSARAAIDRALRKHGTLTIRELGEIAGVSHPMRTVCALAWKRLLAVDLSRQLDVEARVAKRIDSHARSDCSAPPPSYKGGTLTKTWQQQLVDLHPDLFAQTFRGVDFAPGYPTCGDGWCDTVTTLVERVSAAAVGYQIHFTQILERYGRLTIYWKAEANLPKRVEHVIAEAIALAEARASCTCVSCGAKGQLFSSGSCLFTACPKHARGVSVPVRPGTEDLHLVRAFVDDDNLSTPCRRYDRLHDQFVDVDPRSLGLEDQSRERPSSPISKRRRPSGI